MSEAHCTCILQLCLIIKSQEMDVWSYFSTQLNPVFSLNNNNENEQFSLPFYHLHQVCDQNNQMIHTLTAPACGNTACDSESIHSNNLVFYIMYETIKYTYASIKILYCIIIYSEPWTTSLQNLYISKAYELVKSQKAHKSQKTTMTRNNFYHHRQDVTMQSNEIKTILHVKPLGTIPFCHFRPVCAWHYPMIHTLTAPGHENATCDFQSTHQYSKPRTVNWWKYVW